MNVRVHQHFQGLDVSGKRLAFAGKINSPIN
jgi:hypothetical protein